MSELRPWPLIGYAPGGYFCKCSTCGEQFQGDKRAIMCLPCAASRANELLNTRPPPSETPAPDANAEWAREIAAEIARAFLSGETAQKLLITAIATALAAAQEKALERAESKLTKLANDARATAALFRGDSDCLESCRAWTQRASMFDESAIAIRALRKEG